MALDTSLETPPLDDTELVARCRAGETAAFAQIVARYQSLICALTYSATGNVHQSEDLAQETFVAAWNNLSGLREPDKLRAWLCGIARNRALNRNRDNRREPSHAGETLENIASDRTDEGSPDTLAMEKDEQTLVWRALEGMPETYREPLVLYYRQHQSVEHVAGALDLTEDAVKQRLARGRNMLQERVLAMVEGTLGRTNPGSAFTANVMAALPVASASLAKTTGLAATATKGLAAAKGTGILGLLGTLFWPVTAIIATLRIAVISGGPDLTAEQIKARKKPSSASMLVELALLGVIVYSALHYYPTHPNWVYAGLAGFVVVHFLVTAWYNPQQATAWLTTWRWDWKKVSKAIIGLMLTYVEATLLYFATIYYRNTTLIALRYIYVALFLTLMLLGMKKLTRWNWWRFTLHRTGNATAWVMIFMVKDYWSAHPVEFCGAALSLILGFTLAELTAQKWEAQTSPDPQKLRQWEEKQEKSRLKRLPLQNARQARAAAMPDFKDLLKNQWAMTKIPRIAMIALFAIFVLALPKPGSPFFAARPSFFIASAYGLIGLMSLSCMLTFFSWRAWRQRHREKIQLVRAVNDWMEVVEALPILTNVTMILITLTIFFNLDAPSMLITTAVVVFGAGCGMLAKGFSRLAN